jgi:hypothetical protein
MPTSAPRLVFVANLWTLDHHPSPRREWSLARKVRAIAEAGFDALTARAQPEFPALLAQYGLRFTGFFSSSDATEFPALIRAQVDAGAENINVQLGDDFTTATVAHQLTQRLLREAARQRIYTALEVHRDTITETPEKLYALAEAHRRATGRLLPLTWDHSHLAVVKHLKPSSYEPVLLARPDLLQAARLFHCRPFNGQHAQIAVFDTRRRLTPEFREWLRFAEALFRCWLAGPRPTNELWVCPELGPVGIHGYNLSTMPSSWEQALICRRELAHLWRQLTR